MPVLVLPTPVVHRSFLAAMAEFLVEGRGAGSDDSMVAREMREYGGVWETPEGFSQYVERLQADAIESTLRAAYLVPSTTYWWVEGDEYFGRISIRHRLTPRLLEMGGHIGYDVRPSARLRGQATAMLASVLPHAYDLGIDPALVTCDTDNVGSRKVIEANGGVFEDERSGKLRYWVPTSASPA
jgi:predicted acetyltransferase